MSERLSMAAPESDEFEEIILENMRPSFVYETSGEELGVPSLGGKEDVVPHETKPPVDEQEPFGVSLARKMGKVPLETLNGIIVVTSSVVGTLRRDNSTDSGRAADD